MSRWLDLGDGHLHTPKQERPHVATEVAEEGHHPEVAAELSRALRDPFRKAVVGGLSRDLTLPKPPMKSKGRRGPNPAANRPGRQ